MLFGAGAAVGPDWRQVGWSRRAGTTCRNKDGQCYRVPASWMSLPDSLQDTEKSDWQTANTGGQFKVSCFAEESARHTMSFRLKMELYRRTSGD